MSERKGGHSQGAHVRRVWLRRGNDERMPNTLPLRQPAMLGKQIATDAAASLAEEHRGIDQVHAML